MNTANTAGKVARKGSRNKTAKTANATPKRSYLARGTTVKAKRVVLFNGAPVGRGKPSADETKGRMVVYIPVDATYDAKVHGPGVKFQANQHPALGKRLSVATGKVMPSKAKNSAPKAVKKADKVDTTVSVAVATEDAIADTVAAPVAAV
jgi:hypothetical protein